MKLPQWTDSGMCRAAAHCDACQDAGDRGRRFRASTAKFFDGMPADGSPPACPHGRKPKPDPIGGPGTELAKLLGKLGIKVEPGCQCKAHAVEMNRKGADWCTANVPTILGWLEDEAKRRNRTFYPMVAKVLVWRAIARARRSS